ncbi:19459_t:CDS:2 [Gigaspora margarita]|uniref:19459_t:CDS:1 n=1 Tax=Gigaspora margarita TaxID=4874 RepID=A0ABM8VZH6_GIGMA|nr:19459_t:CDS:2 [Gigaspora margarita]
MNASSHVSLKKNFIALSHECIDKILECTKGFDLKYLLTSNGQFSEFDKDEKLKPIRINQITPLYKVLDYINYKMNTPSNDPSKQNFKLLKWSKDEFIDFNNNYLNSLKIDIEFPIKFVKYLCPSDFGYWTFATSAMDDSQLAIKYIIKERLLNFIQSHGTDIPFKAYFMQGVNYENLLRYLKIIETESAFHLITELSLF